MFVRNGEKLGSVLVDADSSEAEPDIQPAANQPEPEPESVPEPVEEPTATEPEVESETVSTPKPPRHVYPKSDWVAFAVDGAEENERVSREEAEAMTKAELIEMFGD